MAQCRCPWLDLSKPDYVKYHDQEWGVPVFDDCKHFEYLTLESAQAGLSWYTILKRRDSYRNLYHGFDVLKVAEFTENDISKLIENSAIIRNKAKIEASVNNARAFIEVQAKFGSFSNYIWQFVNGKTIVRHPKTLSNYLASSPESDALSRDLKQRGFKFIGSTICYAHMQAAGLINEHAVDCFRKQEIVNQYNQ